MCPQATRMFLQAGVAAVTPHCRIFLLNSKILHEQMIRWRT